MITNLRTPSHRRTSARTCRGPSRAATFGSRSPSAKRGTRRLGARPSAGPLSGCDRATENQTWRGWSDVAHDGPWLRTGKHIRTDALESSPCQRFLFYTISKRVLEPTHWSICTGTKPLPNTHMAPKPTCSKMGQGAIGPLARQTKTRRLSSMPRLRWSSCAIAGADA